jgi:hypothetical protein
MKVLMVWSVFMAVGLSGHDDRKVRRYGPNRIR